MGFTLSIFTDMNHEVNIIGLEFGVIGSGLHLSEQFLLVQKVASEFDHQEEDSHGKSGGDVHGKGKCLFQGRMQ